MSEAAPTSVLINDLSLNFGAVKVLKQLNLSIAEGEFLVLLGSSGCGKSTLLNCIAGLLEPSDGQIFINGRNVTWDEPSKRGIGMVFQSYALYPQMSVKGNLTFGLKNARMPRGEIEQRVAHAARVLQIEPLLKRKPAELSGGQRQRVAIGRALVRDVDVFLFDEPLSNLDAKLRADLRVEIKLLHQRLGNTMIYVTHDQVEAMTLADRIAVMKGGQIMQLGTPHEIYHRPENLYVADFIGSPAMNFLDGQLEGSTLTVAGETFEISACPLKSDTTSTTRSVRVGLRPEHIVEVPETDGAAPSWSAHVKLVEPMGADTQVWTELDSGPALRVRVDGTVTLHPRQTIKLGFDPKNLSLFDLETEARL